MQNEVIRKIIKHKSQVSSEDLIVHGFGHCQVHCPEYFFVMDRIAKNYYAGSFASGNIFCVASYPIIIPCQPLLQNCPLSFKATLESYYYLIFLVIIIKEKSEGMLKYFSPRKVMIMNTCTFLPYLALCICLVKSFLFLDLLLPTKTLKMRFKIFNYCAYLIFFSK